MKSVLFVCLGNICRSPLAEGVLQSLLTQYQVDSQVNVSSAAIKNYHIGKQPDARAIITAQKYGIDISRKTARQIHIADFDKYDYIIPMDNRNVESLHQLSGGNYDYKIKSLLKFYAPGVAIDEVSDPFHGTIEDFESLIPLLEYSCLYLLFTILKENNLALKSDTSETIEYLLRLKRDYLYRITALSNRFQS